MSASSIVEYGPPAIFALLTLWIMGAHKKLPLSHLLPEIGLPNRWLPLQEAARRVYDGIQGTAISQIIMGESQTAHEKLKACADLLLGHGFVHAQRAPSIRYERVSRDDAGNVYVRDDLESIGRLFDAEPTFLNARVSRADLRAFFKWVSEQESAINTHG